MEKSRLEKGGFPLEGINSNRKSPTELIIIRIIVDFLLLETIH